MNGIETRRNKYLCYQYIQQLWFGKKEVEDVIALYGVDQTQVEYPMVVKVLEKSRRDFIRGSIFLSRENIDGKIMAIIRKRSRV